MIAHTDFRLDFFQVALCQRTAADYHHVFQVVAFPTEVPHQLDEHHALHTEQHEAQAEPQENHLTGVVVHMLQGQIAQQQRQTQQQCTQHLAQLPPQPSVAERPVNARKKENSDLHNGKEETDRHVTLQRHVHTCVRQDLIAQPEGDGNHQENDKPVTENVQSVQQLLVFFNHGPESSLRKRFLCRAASRLPILFILS